MVLKLTDGKLLTAEQSVRLAIIDSVDRQQVIKAIVRHLRRVAGSRGVMQDRSPRSWYAARFKL